MNKKSDRRLLPDTIMQLAFDLNENEPLTKEQFAIYEEWDSGKWQDYMKVSVDDPRLLEYLGLYDKFQKRKAAIWRCNNIRRNSNSNL